MPSMQQSPLAQAFRMLLSKYNRYYLSNKGKMQFKPRSSKNTVPGKPATPVNPLQNIFKGLSASLSQITKKPAVVDYKAVVKKFIPENSIPVIPISPKDSKEINFTNPTGNLRNELITSFKHNNEIKTVILKKENDQWYKAAEINNAGYDTINYRGFADIIGDGKKQLLLGLGSKEKGSVLHGYSIENNKANKIFEHNYHKFDVLNAVQGNAASSKAQLAIWNKKLNDAYNIDVLKWNGLQLETQKNTASYYNKNVVPHYALKAKRTPNNPFHWYNLADSLIKSGSTRDALIAIEVGISQDKNSTLKEDFLALKNKITGI
jgi:hypothetical protein